MKFTMQKWTAVIYIDLPVIDVTRAHSAIASHKQNVANNKTQWTTTNNICAFVTDEVLLIATKK